MLNLTNKLYYKGTCYMNFEHMYTEPLFTFNECLRELWYHISGYNKYPLRDLLPYYFEFMPGEPIDNFHGFNIPGIGKTNLVLTIFIKFLHKDNNSNICVTYAKFNVSEYLLFKPNLFDLNSSKFIKLILL